MIRLSRFHVCLTTAWLGIAGCGGGGVGSSGSGGAAGKAGVGTGGARLDPDGGLPGGGGGHEAGAAGGSAGAAGGGRGGAAGNAVACGAIGTAPPAPLRALTRFEYNNSVRDLFANDSRPADALPADGATNVVADAPFRPETVDGLHLLAHDFAVSATKDAASVSALIGCDAATSSEPACQAKLLGELLPRILRRPLTAEDQTDFAEVFATGQRLGGTFASGVRAVMEVALQSPEFVYRVEFGEPIAGAASPGAARPSPYEMAARLSFLLWGSTPDPALLAAAAAGKLRTSDEIATEARRLLADPRAHDVVRYFTFQLMRLHDTDYSGLAAATPAFASLAPLLLEETGRFVDEVTWNGKGDFSALLTSPVSYVNGPLASFYGVPGVNGDDFARVSLDPARRAGLLTQPSVLARMSSGPSNNPSGRGLLVLKGLLCSQLPEPPIDELPLQASPGTTRARTEAATANASCQACHRPLDSAGFAFEHFDAVGRWRDLEADQPIDAHGELIDSDARGRFDGAVELARRLADSQDARACYVEKWMAFAYGRTPSAADACTRSQLLDAFASTGGNIPELLFALTRTEAFLTTF